MKVEGYVDLTIIEVKQILKEYIEKQGYDVSGEVFIPEIISQNTIISVGIEVKPNVGDKQFLVSCVRCNGIGEIPCPGCGTIDINNCAGCNGTKTMHCGVCGGSGKKIINKS